MFFYFLITTTLITVLFLLMLENIHAESPSFSTQTISDYGNDWNIIHSNINNSTCKNIPIELFPDISSASFLSNGNTLNATLWLNGIFDNYMDYLWVHDIQLNTISYTLYIDVHSFFDSGTIKGFPDYTMNLFWDSINRNWSKQINLIMPEVWSEKKPGYRILNQVNNFTNFYSESSNYVDLPLELGYIGFPEKYLLGVQKQVTLYEKW